MSDKIPVLLDEHLPALYSAADTASTKAQTTFINLNRAMLALLVFGATLAAVPETKYWTKGSAALGAAVILGSSLLLNAITRLGSYEAVWYGGRAVAESVKTLAWRYCSGAEPYPLTLTESLADKKLASDLRSILQEKKQLCYEFGGDVGTASQITAEMRSLRSSPLAQRVESYLQYRIKDQRQWYSGKAGTNKNSLMKFFGLTSGAQLLALLSAIVIVRYPESRMNATGILTSVAGSLIAWSQLRQHQELAQSYGLAAHELGLIQEAARHVQNDQEFGSFVADAENAISREHTMWIARRDRS